MEIAIAKLFDLPAHALLVHIPIVLTPLVAVGGLVVAVSASWRHRIGVPLVVVATVLAVGTQLAIGSGEELEDAVRETPLVEAHVGQADLIEPFLLLVLAALIGLLLADRWRRGIRVPRALRRVSPTVWRAAVAAAAIATVASAAVATGLVVRAGHSGARAVWKESDQIVRPLGG